MGLMGGDDTAGALREGVSPFQGLETRVVLRPRAVPWVGGFSPVGVPGLRVGAWAVR